MAQDNIPKNQIKTTSTILQREHEDDVAAKRVILIGTNGEFRGYDPANPLFVQLSDGSINIQTLNAELQVQLEGEYDATSNPNPDSVGIVGHIRGASQANTSQLNRLTSVRGSVDTDSVSLDVALHDSQGDTYNLLNPLAVVQGFEKFFQIIGDSNWMKLASYDQVIPTFSNGNTTLTLQYKEDGDILGEAIINLTSVFAWDVTLIRYLTEDDGTPLQDDDDTDLNLD